MHLRLSLFFLKSAPGGTLSSADTWALATTRPVELLSLKACTTVRTRQAAAGWANFEAPSSRAD